MCGTTKDEEDKTDITIARMREKNTQYGKITSLYMRMKDCFYMIKNKASKVTVELKKHLLMINVDVAGSILGKEMALVTTQQILVDFIDKKLAKVMVLKLK